MQAPACVTVTVAPATVKVPVRDDVEVFAAATKVLLPEPLPVAPLPIESQAALLVADQVQPVVVVTAAVSEPPAAPTEAVVGATVYAHWFCVTVIVCPATVKVPERVPVEPFIATV